MPMQQKISCLQTAIQVALYFDENKNGAECPRAILAKVSYACEEALSQIRIGHDLDLGFLKDMDLPAREFDFLLETPCGARRD